MHMPRGDRTGPNGGGSMTGRGLGYCAGYDAPGYMHPAPRMGGMGRGIGYGGRGYAARGRMRGRGYGWYEPGFRRWAPDYRSYPVSYPVSYPAPPTADEEMKYLQGDVDYLKQELKAAEDRIAELQKAGEE